MNFRVPATIMASVLAADTEYYMDVQIITPLGEVYTIIKDVIRAWKQPTTSTSP